MPKVLPAIALLAMSADAGAAAEPVATEQGSRTAQITRLFAAIRAGQLQDVERLLQANPALLTTTSPTGSTPLIAAALTRKGPVFLKPEENPVYRAIAARLQSPGIMEASLLGRRDVVERLIRQNRQAVDEQMPSGWTPLHFAAFAGQLDVARLLLANGAQLDRAAIKAFGTTPLQAAVLAGRLEVAAALLDAGANPYSRSNEGGSYLHETAIAGDVDMAKLLRRRGVPLTARNDSGKTALELATERGNAAVADALR